MSVKKLSFSYNSKYILISTFDNLFFVYNFETKMLIFQSVFEQDPHGIFSSVDETFALCSQKKIMICEVNGKALYEFNGHTKTIICAAYSRCGQLLASAGKDKLIKIWNVKTYDFSCDLKGHWRSITDIAFLRNKLLVSGSKDETVRI